MSETFLAEKGRVSIQWRCPNMARHGRLGDPTPGGCACHPRIPAPCPDCYSLRVTSVRISFEPPSDWADLAVHRQFTDESGTWCHQDCPMSDEECARLAVEQNAGTS